MTASAGESVEHCMKGSKMSVRHVIKWSDTLSCTHCEVKPMLHAMKGLRNDIKMVR